MPIMPAAQPTARVAQISEMGEVMTLTDIDELTEIIEAWDETPQCDHSQHSTRKAAHAGDAVWETTTTCRHCGNVTTGLRCDQWRVYCVSTRGQVYCTTCGNYQTTYDYYRDTHWRKL